MVAFASLLAADVTAILAFCTVPACLLCNSGIADLDFSGSSTDLTTPKFDFRGRDASYLAPPAQIRASPIRAHGSHLGCLTAKRLSGHG